MTKSEKKRVYKAQDRVRLAKRKKENTIFLSIVIVSALVIGLVFCTPVIKHESEREIAKRLEEQSPAEIALTYTLLAPLRVVALQCIVVEEIFTRNPVPRMTLEAHVIREQCLISRMPLPEKVVKFIEQLEENGE